MGGRGFFLDETPFSSTRR